MDSRAGFQLDVSFKAVHSDYLALATGYFGLVRSTVLAQVALDGVGDAATLRVDHLRNELVIVISADDESGLKNINLIGRQHQISFEKWIE